MENTEDKFLNHLMKESVVTADSNFAEKVIAKIQPDTTVLKKKSIFSTIEFQSIAALLLGIIVYSFINPDFLKIINQSLIQITKLHYFGQTLTFLFALVFLILVDVIIRKSKVKLFLTM